MLLRVDLPFDDSTLPIALYPTLSRPVCRGRHQVQQAAWQVGCRCRRTFHSAICLCPCDYLHTLRPLLWHAAGAAAAGQADADA